jgi:hypothetical protein
MLPVETWIKQLLPDYLIAVGSTRVETSLSQELLELVRHIWSMPSAMLPAEKA